MAQVREVNRSQKHSPLVPASGEAQEQVRRLCTCPLDKDYEPLRIGCYFLPDWKCTMEVHKLPPRGIRVKMKSWHAKGLPKPMFRTCKAAGRISCQRGAAGKNHLPFAGEPSILSVNDT